jgi:hypothetical protein
VFPTEETLDESESAAVFVFALVSGSEALRKKLKGQKPQKHGFYQEHRI